MYYIKCDLCNSIVKAEEAEINEEKEQGICKECFYKKQDNFAYNESHGLYRNYEDYMENEYGATICDSRDNFKREY